ncbi:MAG: rod shape-determining protein MreC [Oscillospiraceae bacterium]|nr:rod shape-determining protein MreC [Oscillospiraceae bacterium]
MRFLLKHKGLLAAAAAVLLAFVLAVVSSLTGGYASPVSNLLGTVFQPLQSGIAGLSDSIASLYGYMYEHDALKEENERLKIQIAEMEAAARLSEASNDENERLRQLLGLSERRRDFVFESATITERDASNWASTLTLSRGSANGIAPGQCVISEAGYLVGVINEAGTTWSTVTTLIDTDMEAGAFVFRTGLSAVVEGNFDLMRQGFLRMSYLAKDVDVKNGDVVLTSGIGGKYPRDIVVGRVTNLYVDETGISAYAVIRPSVELEELKQVFVIKSFDISE